MTEWRQISTYQSLLNSSSFLNAAPPADSFWAISIVVADRKSATRCELNLSDECVGSTDH